MEKHYDLMFDARETSLRFQQQAQKFRQVREAKLAQLKTKLSLKHQFGRQLIAFGRKLTQDAQPAFVE